MVREMEMKLAGDMLMTLDVSTMSMSFSCLYSSACTCERGHSISHL